MELGESRPPFYFDVHGEVNTDKTIELARERADELGVGKVVVASGTGLSALKGPISISWLTREVATERGSPRGSR